MLDLMRRYSGLVVLHEIYLGGLALNASAVGRWPAGLAASLRLENRSDLAESAGIGEVDHHRIADEVPMNRALLAFADALVVHNAWSWARMRAVTDVPVFRIQMGMPETPRLDRDDARRRLGLPPDAFIVATLGEVRASKHIDRIIEAIASLPASLRANLQLLVVGDGPTDLMASLGDLAVRAGVNDRVRFTGRVPLDDLGAYGCAADACVQLRHPVRGETSGALLRALAAGSACIVSDTGSLSEVGREAALFVPPGAAEVATLRDALVRLHEDPELGRRLRDVAVAWIRAHHRLQDAAAGYASAIALTIAERRRRNATWRDAAVWALDSASASVEIPEEVVRRWTDIETAMRESTLRRA
jgi:glycosyltransferase involved in cell wall biosynthesis